MYKQSANLGLSAMHDVTEGGRSQRMADAVRMLLQARAMVRPTDEELRGYKTNRKSFERTVRRLADSNSNKDSDALLDINTSRSSPGLRALGYGLGGGAAGAGAGMLTGNPLIGAGLGASAGAAYGYGSGKSRNKDLLRTARALKDYGVLTPGALQKSLPLLLDKVGAYRKKADLHKTVAQETAANAPNAQQSSPWYHKPFDTAFGKDWGEKYLDVQQRYPKAVNAVGYLPGASQAQSLLSAAENHGKGNMGGMTADLAGLGAGLALGPVAGKFVGKPVSGALASGLSNRLASTAGNRIGSYASKTISSAATHPFSSSLPQTAGKVYDSNQRRTAVPNLPPAPAPNKPAAPVKPMDMGGAAAGAGIGAAFGGGNKPSPGAAAGAAVGAAASAGMKKSSSMKDQLALALAEQINKLF